MATFDVFIWRRERRPDDSSDDEMDDFDYEIVVLVVLQLEAQEAKVKKTNDVFVSDGRSVGKPARVKTRNQLDARFEEFWP